MLVAVTDPEREALLRRGFAMEYATLAWNVAGIVVLAIAALAARAMALAGFGLDSLIGAAGGQGPGRIGAQQPGAGH